MEPDERARHVKALATNPVLTEMLAQMEADKVLAWKAATNTANREQLHAEMLAISNLRGRIYAANAGNPNKPAA